jgi:hypothetical protein
VIIMIAAARSTLSSTTRSGSAASEACWGSELPSRGIGLEARRRHGAGLLQLVTSGDSDIPGPGPEKRL